MLNMSAREDVFLRRSHSHFLERFLFPKSVAVVGVSRDPARIHYNLVANLVKLGFKGRVYPVNPHMDEILGLRAYPDLTSIEDDVDLVVVAVSHTKTLEILEDCVKKGVRCVVIVAGGFSETGQKGRELQRRMASLLARHKIRAIGPNALSPINVPIGLAISFHPLENLHEGGLSLIFQSGLYEPRLLWLFSRFNLRLNKLVDLGNKMDVNEVDVLSYLVDDEETRVIGIHMESIEGDGREFLNLLGRATSRKHVVVLKSGRTEAGARAVESHTGVMVRGSDVVFDSALRQFGAIRANTIEQFFYLCRSLERFGERRMKGNRVAIATLPGGEAVVVTDLCEQSGLRMARVSRETHERLRPIFPPWEIEANPFDLGVCLQFHNPKEVYARVSQALVDDPEVDAVALQVATPMCHLRVEFFEPLLQAARMGKPLLIWAPGIEPGETDTLRSLEERGVVFFPGPEKAIEALAALYRSSRSMQ
jgi:acetyltransferase